MQNVIRLMVLFLLVSSSIKAENSKFRVSALLVGMSMDYRETDIYGDISNTEQSNFSDLGGMDIGVSYLLSNSSNKSIELESNLVFLTGKTDYTGSYVGEDFGSLLSRTVDNIIDFDVMLKRNHKFNNGLNYYYAVGLGYRYWERVLKASQIEDYEWYSLRAQLGLDYKITDKLKVGTEFEYQYSFSETMYASNLGYTFDLGGANIMKISLPISYAYTKNMNIIAELIYEKQTIKRSNFMGVENWYEPDSIAKNQYIKVGVNFKF